MKRLAALLALPLLLGACSSTFPALDATYEREDLVSVRHNQANDYTLLIYRDALGQTRHVLRKHGICEILLTYTVTGAVVLKERGQDPRMLSHREAAQVAERIKVLLQMGAQSRQAVSTT